MSRHARLTLERPLRFDTDGPELAGERALPPPPHDPRERDLVLTVEAWEVRLFGSRKFQYFVTRGLWHLQLWHPEAQVSVLTPSRLTSGRYEAFPVANWKAQATDYDALVALLKSALCAPLPSKAEVLRLEKVLVDDLVRARGTAIS